MSKDVPRKNRSQSIFMEPTSRVRSEPVEGRSLELRKLPI